MQDTFALHQACYALDYTPQRLQQEWPCVSSEVSQLVSEFCYRQTGFGRLAWDSPGYEDPYYVIRLLHSAFDEMDAEQLRRRSLPKTPQSLRPLPACERRSLRSGVCLGFGWIFWNGRHGMCAVRFMSA